MNFTQLVSVTGSETSTSEAKVCGVLSAAFEEIGNALAEGDFVSIRGVGKFESVHRNARKFRHPVTGAEIHVSARREIKFTASNKLKEKVNKAV